MRGHIKICERDTDMLCEGCKLPCWNNLVDDRRGALEEFQQEPGEDDRQSMIDEAQVLLQRSHNRLKPMTPQ